jgi:hypothetical protein
MKLATFEQRVGFRFVLTFENGDQATVDLEPLIGNHISVDQLGSAEVDPDWGCLQFLGGSVDIEPTTLYRYAMHPPSGSTVPAPADAQPAHQPGRLPLGRR